MLLLFTDLIFSAKWHSGFVFHAPRLLDFGENFDIPGIGMMRAESRGTQPKTTFGKE